jgi:hypothetical protein
MLNGVADMSMNLIQVRPWGILYMLLRYDHPSSLRLEKVSCIEISRSSNGYFKPLLNQSGGFASEIAARRFQK